MGRQVQHPFIRSGQGRIQGNDVRLSHQDRSLTSIKMVFPSPHYSASGALRLLQDLDCEALLATKERPPIVSQVLRLQQYRELEVPTIEHILGDNSARYPYEKTFEQAHNEPLVVLHTSGTTGHPKPVIWTHDWAASFLRLRTWDPPPGYVLQDDLIQGKRLFSFFPPWAVSWLLISVPVTRVQC